MIREKVLEGRGKPRSSNLVQKPFFFLISSSRPSERQAVDTVGVDLFVIYRGRLCDLPPTGQTKKMIASTFNQYSKDRLNIQSILQKEICHLDRKRTATVPSTSHTNEWFTCANFYTTHKTMNAWVFCEVRLQHRVETSGLGNLVNETWALIHVGKETILMLKHFTNLAQDDYQREKGRAKHFQTWRGDHRAFDRRLLFNQNKVQNYLCVSHSTGDGWTSPTRQAQTSSSTSSPFRIHSHCASTVESFWYEIFPTQGHIYGTQIFEYDFFLFLAIWAHARGCHLQLFLCATRAQVTLFRSWEVLFGSFRFLSFLMAEHDSICLEAEMSSLTADLDAINETRVAELESSMSKVQCSVLDINAS